MTGCVHKDLERGYFVGMGRVQSTTRCAAHGYVLICGHALSLHGDDVTQSSSSRDYWYDTADLMYYRASRLPEPLLNLVGP